MEAGLRSVVALTAVMVCGSSAPAMAAAQEAAWERVASGGHAGATFRLNPDAIEKTLDGAPQEDTRAARERPARVSIPRPDGTLEKFEVSESPVMEPGLAARHPEIKTYAGHAVADAARTIRLDVSPLGVHASVQGGGASYWVEPSGPAGSEHVASTGEGTSQAPDQAVDDVVHELGPEPAAAGPDVDRGETVGLRVYRLALITDHTYAETVRDPAAPAGTGFRTTAAKVALVNRINHILERDWAARLVLVADNDKLNLDTRELSISPGGPCGDLACYSATQLSSCPATLSQNTVVAGLLVGARNYDIGHMVMSVNTGGVAALRGAGGARKAEACSGNKARSVTKYWLAMVFAHELGHQFGGHHTWSRCNSASGISAGVEPGGGATILAYPGVCPWWNEVQADREGYYSQHSLAEFHANARAARPPLSSVQDIRINGFEDGDSYRLSFRGGRTAPLTLADHTPAGIKAAIEGMPGWPVDATVTPLFVSDDAVVLEFGGSLAGVAVELFGIEDAVGVDLHVGERVAGGEQTNGGRVEPTDNHHPVVTAPTEVTIPLRTPFTLTGHGNDSDGDTLTYLWEQTDGSENGSHDLDVTARVRGPLFSVFSTTTPPGSSTDQYPETDEWRLQGRPTPQPSRSLPDIAQVLADNTNAATGKCPSAAGSPQAKECLAELLPGAGYIGTRGDRTMGFRLTARDNNPGAGGTAFADTVVRINNAAGPFRVTAPATATTVAPGGTLTVTWNVAGTEQLADRVAIKLSVNGGRTFPGTLAAQTPNDGEATVEIPRDALTSRGVLKVEAVGGVWFDVARGVISTATDTTAPTAAPAFVETSSNGWYREDVTVVWNWSDDDTGTGINPAACPTTSKSSGAGADVKVTATCTDRAGNTAEKTVNLKIDKTPPVIALATRPPANANGWHTTAVTITWTCTDELSGVVSAGVSATLGRDGGGQTAYGRCADNAGNTAWNAQSGVNIDTTAPTIDIASPVDGAAYDYEQPLTASYACADAVGASGVASCSGEVATGSPVDTTKAGQHSFTVHATDVAGNAASTTVRYVVEKAPTRLDAAPLLLDLQLGLPTVTLGQVSARLTYGAADKPAAGRRVRFASRASPLCSATTAADGVARCTFEMTALLRAALAAGYTATFDGDSNLLPSSGHGPTVRLFGVALL